MYLFLSGMKSNSRRMALTKLVFGGIMISFALSAWGGAQFFIVPIGIFLFAYPIIRKDFSASTLRIVVFAASLLVTMAFFEKGGVNAITGMVGPAIIIPTVFNVICYIIQKKWPQKARFIIIRMFASLMGISIVAVIVNSAYQILPFGHRQFVALNPFLKSESVISQSVAEHATTTITQSFSFFSILLIFSGLGAWFLLVNRDKMKTYLPNIPFDMAVYALILSIMGVYLSSAFIRLELYTTIATSVLASIAIAIISAEVLKPRTQSKKHSKIHPTVKIAFVVAIVVLLITPTLTPVYGNWTNANRGPPTLLTGGSNVAINNDWSETFEWIKTNTPKDAIIGSWWDYGYWLTTMTDRISLADNGTLSTLQIAKIGRTLVSDPDEAWRVLTDWDVDYFMIFIAAQKLQGTPPLYLLNGGGDESKKVWFIRIGGEDLHRYTYSDGFSGTDYFWEDTLLGSMIPFSISTYYNQQTENCDQSPTYRTGYVGIYHKEKI